MISSVSGQAAQPAAPLASAQAPAAAPVQAAAVTVQISATAQVKQLDASGSTLQEIVLKTGLDLATVRQLLGV